MAKTPQRLPPSHKLLEKIQKNSPLVEKLRDQKLSFPRIKKSVFPCATHSANAFLANGTTKNSNARDVLGIFQVKKPYKNTLLTCGIFPKG